MEKKLSRKKSSILKSDQKRPCNIYKNHLKWSQNGPEKSWIDFPSLEDFIWQNMLFYGVDFSLAR